jgi:serine/threonine-protein kinase
MTVEEAQATLEAAGFVFGEIVEVADPDTAVGDVVGSSPAEGTQAQGGSVIDIQVSNGQVEVPDVVGKTLAEASALLQGTTVQLTVIVEADSACNTKLVSSQSIAPGLAKQHSEITIVYCAGS